MPDLQWLKQQISDSLNYSDIYLISHQGPYHSELEEPKAGNFHNLLKNNRVRLAIHGHSHWFTSGELYKQGVQYLSIDNIRDRNYVMLKVFPEGYEFTQVFY